MKPNLSVALIIWLMLTGLTATAQHHSLREVTVTARRPLKDIGLQRTDLDSAALKENIAQSMADVLAYNSSIFVKQSGRATLSTVAFRGTSPSHTQVTWNGLNINSPMLGMTDFSLIPSYFIDNAALLHGASSVNDTGGGLGGLIKLSTSAEVPDGISAQYVQGAGSFSTFDEFAHISYGGHRWNASTRAVYSSSANDFSYTNHDKKLNIYDEDKNIIDQYHPRERNRNGAYRDLHLLQEISYNSLKGDRVKLSAWYTDSHRETPMLSTDYSESIDYENSQHERTLRAMINWLHTRSRWKTGIDAGYAHTLMNYDYRRGTVQGGSMSTMTRSRSRVNTFHGHADAEFMPARQWLFTAGVSADQHLVLSHDRSIAAQDGQQLRVGYDVGRLEMSGSLSAKWRPSDRMGMSFTLRQELHGTEWAPLIPAFFIEGTLIKPLGLEIKASVSRNHKSPSLNDLYFMPGGNPDLKSEHGFSYDCSLGVTDRPIGGLCRLSASVTWFDSRIDDWIIWLPTTKGFFSPRNVKKVHAYGVEANATARIRPARLWMLTVNGSMSWTPSINKGDKMSEADASTGKQLPYVPQRSASLTACLSWQSWSLLYKWCHYSQRFTMSSNDHSLTGYLPPYYMSDISLEKRLAFKPADLSLKLAVHNILNEDYLSVLSRPMPGINFEFFISITPKFKRDNR